MYYEHFGLAQAPFRITPNTDFFFAGGNRGPILEALMYAVTNGEGIIKVSGEVGSGKTMLCNMLMERLPANVETIYLANPSVSPEEILHAIAFELQLGTERYATRLEVMQALQARLLSRHAEGKRVVMFVEESQGMPLATLEEIRLLSNLETRTDKLLQIVLFGQPELDDNLRQPHIRQLRERITQNFRLAPLTAPEIHEYLMFRMRAAGYHGPDLFADTVVKRIAQASGGLTRRVNLIADKALLAAFSENTHTVKLQHVEAALRDSEFHRDAPGVVPARNRGWAVAALTCAAGVAIGAAGYAWLSQPNATVASAAAVPKTAQDKPSAPLPLEDAQNAVVVPVPAAAMPASITTTASATANDDILAERLGATVQWLAKQSDATWTLQTLSTLSEDDLRNHLRFLKKSIEINDIFVYRNAGNADQKAVLSVFYGTYSSRLVAEQKMAELPAQLKSNRPLPRTVQSIRDGLR
jgi:type II secretory pathway predicted ATPase ExeA